MNTSSLKTKLTTLVVLACASQLSAITSNMTHRVMSSSSLIYKMIDYSQHQTSYEIEPIFSAMYDMDHTNQNLILDGKSSLVFDQQGQGDLNPAWLNLTGSVNADYNSLVTFTPKLRQAGILLHWYEQFEKTFIDIKTALVQCTSEIEITEVGGGNGLLPGILNAQQAFTQSNFNYGKIGQSNHVAGLDDIEIRFGAVTEIPHAQGSYQMFLSGFGIVQAPTGSGTKAEWLFEPQVGTNHWGLGLGIEASLINEQDINFMIAANVRYLTPASEIRSFDLTENGQWSRYLSLQELYGLPTAVNPTLSGPLTLGLPGINLLTQSAYINGRSELNFYTRLAKTLGNCLFELSYNYSYLQAETIGSIATIPSGYGIYTVNSLGGVSTSSAATINQNSVSIDSPNPIEVTTSMLDKLSAQAGSTATNTLTARIEKVGETFVYGVGANIEVAQSASALSTWAVWAKFEFLFDK